MAGVSDEDGGDDAIPDWFQGEASAALGPDWLTSQISPPSVIIGEGTSQRTQRPVLPPVQTTSARARGGRRTVSSSRTSTQTAPAAVDLTDTSTAIWDDENTRIVCEFCAEQVEIGNRSSTHLNKAGFDNVIRKFKERTGILHKRKQFKNKWDKLKIDHAIWKKLTNRETGLGWDASGTNIVMDEGWWKKMADEVKGSGRFRYRGLQNEDNLDLMFEGLQNTGADHWSASSGVAPSPISVDDEDEANNDDDSDPEHETPTSVRSKRGKVQGNNQKGKKAKTSGGQWFKEQMGILVEMNQRTTASCESIARKEDTSGCSIPEVMALVKDCGATVGTKEHFIATIVFTKKAEREMFMTIDTPEHRF